MAELVNNRIGIFVSCCVDQHASETAWRMIHLLESLGLQCDYPLEFTCCGKELYFNGDIEGARQLAEKTLDEYRDFDYIVACGSGCVAYMKRHFETLFRGTTRQGSYPRFLERLYDISDFLVNVLHYTPQGVVFPHKVAILDHCTSLRDLGLYEQPRQLLRAVEGLEIVEMEQPEVCCGFGGFFSNLYEPVSTDLARRKVENAIAAGAHYIVSTEMSCLLHLQSYIDKHNLNIQTLHLVDILYQ